MQDEKLYNEHEAGSKVMHFECNRAYGEYKGYKVVIYRGRGCVWTRVKCDDEELENEIINELIDSQVEIFKLI